MRCLARLPEYRPAAEALAAELAAASPAPQPRPARGRTRLATTRLLPTRPLDRPRVDRRPRSRRRLWLGAATGGAALTLLGVALVGRGDEPEPPRTAPNVQPAPRGATPEAGARNLSAWLRRYSG